MDVGGGDEGMDPSPLAGILEGLPGPVNVLVAGAAQACDLGSLDGLCYLFDRFKISIRCDRETGLDDIDIQFLQFLLSAVFLRCSCCCRGPARHPSTWYQKF